MTTQFEKDFYYDPDLAKQMIDDPFKAPEQRKEAQEFLDSIKDSDTTIKENEMPAGIPKDPAAHAAIMAAKPKRPYKRRTQMVKSSNDTISNTVISSTEVVNYEKTIQGLEEKITMLEKSNEQLRDRDADSYNRLMAVLDLVSMVKPQKI